MFEFTDVKTAKAVVNYETGRNKVVYSEYIAANGVTLDNVSAHVAGLQSLAFPTFDAKTASDEDKYARKSFGSRVRNGLNTHLGKVVPSKAAKVETADESDEDAAGDVPPVTVTVTPVGAFLAAVEAFHAAGYSLPDARAILADVYGSADRVAA